MESLGLSHGLRSGVVGEVADRGVVVFPFQKESPFFRRQDFQSDHGIQARHDLGDRKAVQNPCLNHAPVFAMFSSRLGGFDL